MQDVPSFLQEVTTVRGQLLYGTPAVRAQAGVPESTDPHDEVAVAQLGRLVTLDAMRQRKYVSESDGDGAANGAAAAGKASSRGARCATARVLFNSGWLAWWLPLPGAATPL